ncbi:hypothetical protein GCM10020229_27570 [Kitasatospora albolonga]
MERFLPIQVRTWDHGSQRYDGPQGRPRLEVIAVDGHHSQTARGRPAPGLPHAQTRDSAFKVLHNPDTENQGPEARRRNLLFARFPMADGHSGPNVWLP